MKSLYLYFFLCLLSVQNYSGGIAWKQEWHRTNRDAKKIKVFRNESHIALRWFDGNGGKCAEADRP